jgi:hypothetical protein
MDMEKMWENLDRIVIIFGLIQGMAFIIKSAIWIRRKQRSLKAILIVLIQGIVYIGIASIPILILYFLGISSSQEQMTISDIFFGLLWGVLSFVLPFALPALWAKTSDQAGRIAMMIGVLVFLVHWIYFLRDSINPNASFSRNFIGFAFMSCISLLGYFEAMFSWLVVNLLRQQNWFSPVSVE